MRQSRTPRVRRSATSWRAHASEIGRVCVTGVDDTTDGVVHGLLRQARLSLVYAVEFVAYMMAKENEL